MSRFTTTDKLFRQVILKERPFILSTSHHGKYIVRRYLKLKICATCGKEFYTPKNKTKFCCRKCVKITHSSRKHHKLSERSNGYRWIFKPDHPKANRQGYVYNHRFIAEQKIGRILEDWEVVHHKDKNKKNDDPNNLEILSQYDHALLHVNDRWVGRKFWHKNSSQCETVKYEKK